MSDIQFKYFYGNESELFTFYRIPKELITNPRFKNLSNDAKLLYGLMLDRMALSAKNHWFDKNNRVYIYFSVVDVMEQLNIGRNKAIKLFKELDNESGIGLIEKKQQGQGKPAMIHVKSFVIEEDKEFSKEFEKQTSKSLEHKPQEVSEANPNNTKENNTNGVIKSNHIDVDTMDMENTIRN
ncbi:Replication initiator protein A (RepA) N-terminus [Pseudobutyrivibrio sp. 49]|nr:replication initiator protein A [Pseudobutyrivibrio sp. 49]SDH69679.1 Replication initiator protein A (RepA) N-terminus [Pseudobutyrivibrio sp. 49]